MTLGLHVINKMVNRLHCCVFLPVTLLAALCTDTGHNSTFVCVGDSVRVFQDITSTSFNSSIIIYKTFADKAEAIVTRTFGKNIIHKKFKDKVSLENGAMLIHNFQAPDEANYVMLYNDSSKRKDVQICASAPPTKSCKPKIEEDGNILTVSLGDHNYCGKPVVSVYWMESPNISHIDETIIKLLPGSESDAGTYRACMKGEALLCVKNRTGWDNCVNYTTKSMRGNNVPATSTDVPQTKTNGFTTVVIVSIVLFIVSLVLIGVILIIFILRRQSGKLSKLKTATEQHDRAPAERSMRNHPLLEDESGSDGEQRNEEAEDDTYV